MRGEFIGVWSETWREIWTPLIVQEGVPEDIFCELYRELAPALRTRPSIEDLADIIDNPAQGREAFERTTTKDLAGERALVTFLEAAHEALDELGGDPLSNSYFNLLSGFIEKFSLRYELRRPCTVSPSLPGIVTNVINSVRAAAVTDAHLNKLQNELDEAIRDLRAGRTESRIKTVLMKHYVLVEGIANSQVGNAGKTLGECCNGASWPHKALRSAAGNVYGFRSNYPGLGHAGNPLAADRDLDDRELVGVSCMLLGIVPYVAPIVDLDQIYGKPAHLSNLVPPLVEAAPSPGRAPLQRIGQYLRSLWTSRGA